MHDGLVDQHDPRDGVPSPVLLARVRTIAEALIVARGGTAAEADVVAEEIVAYVDFNWSALGLRVLATYYPGRWERHITREVYRRWLAHLARSRGRWAAPASQSLARARILALADSADLPAEDRRIFDFIYVHGFSVAETAIVFDLETSQLVQRLRRAWVAVRRDAHLTASRPADAS
jgi:hypothetical protein